MINSTVYTSAIATLYPCSAQRVCTHQDLHYNRGDRKYEVATKACGIEYRIGHRQADHSGVTYRTPDHGLPKTLPKRPPADEGCDAGALADIERGTSR